MFIGNVLAFNYVQKVTVILVKEKFEIFKTSATNFSVIVATTLEFSLHSYASLSE
jgi:hypothetical protein